MLAKVDPKGRLYLPKELRKNLPKEVYLVRVDDGILIVPKPEDPLKELEELGKNLPDIPIKEIRVEILKEAEKLAGE
ncbi:AbrB/MazE/SpoVT family DNA-binding domain-containing protein [Thermococcus sp. MAR1]|uniref:AbrB/MazE/SpoVT family DNA-binding domain-containing protein n=1 Tax=Thermococcus sp. MAR1 TaxID=1638263 RepID=UPI0014397763|nr:AbrB/MazE/SpoVT family DNA-binding domain-containing protein [Thermococcus sp. MAR1]NJE09720.1 AbrB family transcriptional regulator [Thermococcus sp. MAR1]